MLDLISVEINLSKHSDSTHIALNLLDSPDLSIYNKNPEWNNNYITLKLAHNIMYLHI